MNHLDHFGFNKEPFSLSPATTAFYNSAQHAGVVRTILQAVESSDAFAIVQGPSGTGKTTVAYQAIAQLSSELYARAYVKCNAGMTTEGMAASVAIQLGGDAADSLAEALERTESSQIVLFLDDADRLHVDVLSDIVRSTAQAKTVLLGRDVLKFATLRSGDPTLITLAPLTEKGTGRYIKNRLRSAGVNAELFANEAIQIVYRRTGGNPAAINDACDRLLVAAALRGDESVSFALVDGLLIQEPEEEPIKPETATISEVGISFADEATIGAGADTLAEDELDQAVSSAFQEDEEAGLGALLDEFTNSADDAQSDSDVFAELAADSAPDQEDDVQDLLAEFESQNPETEEPAASSQGEDLDSLLMELDGESSSAAEEIEIEAEASDDDLDALLADLDTGADEPTDVDDLDALLDQLEDSTVSAGKPAATQVAAKQNPASKSADSELDDLLSQIDEMQDV